jgi:hypothetical protein
MLGCFRLDTWCRCCGRRLDSLDEARRRQDRRGRLRRFGCLLGRRGLLAFLNRSFGKDVAGWQRDIALPGQTVHELSRDDLLDGAGRALHLDAVIALQQRGYFLAGRAEKLCDFVNPNS